ncbi:DNA polymerase III subunit gamma/tau [Candidatus Haliotispira prima]|uniref:DNA polymerase III subunit gamma/tau n=1 Tax=Candidatus Haliotispira prima TaxID=3034016 RepID=A0ABY8MHZ1_9SPIO|nr:DNA polymerase III subunit gamma/tau [Candidatus Haliotispira prima]
MEYQVTATRRRPQNLKQLSGQSFVQQTLHNALNSGHIAHAYLFSGPRGVGKTSAARILARALNCEQGPTGTPCGECSNCRDILGGKAMDVIEIDGASHTGVDDIREIKDEVLYAPGSSRYKIFIIDEVHMLSNSAFNALLKTIEEPPEYIVFIFATTEIHKVPLTVRSRCQHYNFHLVSLEQIRQNLAEACAEIGLEYRNEALIWVAREAKGSMRDAYTLFDQVISFCAGQPLTLELIRQKMGLIAVDQLSKLCDALIDENLETAIDLYQQIINGGTSLEQLLVDLCDYLRALLLLQSGLNEQQLLLLLPYPSDHYSPKALQSWDREQLCHILERCFTLYRNLRYSINEHFELELLLFELSQLHYYRSGTRQLQRLEELTNRLQEGLPDYDGQHESPTAEIAGDKKKTLIA